MSLSSEMSDFIHTGRCPRCSRVIMAATDDFTIIAVRIFSAEQLLVSRPKTVDLPNLLSFWRNAGGQFARGPTAGWMEKPPEWDGYSIMTRDARRALKMAAGFPVKIKMNTFSKGPAMICRLCGEDWLVGEWQRPRA